MSKQVNQTLTNGGRWRQLEVEEEHERRRILSALSPHWTLAGAYQRALNYAHYFSHTQNQTKLIYFICLRVVNLRDLCLLPIYWQFYIMKNNNSSSRKMARKLQAKNVSEAPAKFKQSSPLCRPVRCSFCLHFAQFSHGDIRNLLSPATTAATTSTMSSLDTK